jgi:hypothetical protein
MASLLPADRISGRDLETAPLVMQWEAGQESLGKQGAAAYVGEHRRDHIDGGQRNHH